MLLSSQFIESPSRNLLALVNNFNDLLYMLFFDGTDWSILTSINVGPFSGGASLFYYGEDRFGLAKQQTSDLQAYRWTGVTFTPLGNLFNLGFTPNLLASGLIANNKLALYADAFPDPDNLRTIQYNTISGNWSYEGNPLALATNFAPAIAVLGLNLIAVIRPQDDSLRTYSWNGVNWTQVGSTFTITGNGVFACRLGSSGINRYISVYDAVSQELRAYAWNTVTLSWSQVGNALSIAGSQVTQLADFTVAFWGSGTTLRTLFWDGNAYNLIGNVFNFPTTVTGFGIAGLF